MRNVTLVAMIVAGAAAFTLLGMSIGRMGRAPATSPVAAAQATPVAPVIVLSPPAVATAHPATSPAPTESRAVHKTPAISVRHDYLSARSYLRITGPDGNMLERMETEAFIIRNESTSPITIQKVTFNGEYDAPGGTLLTEESSGPYYLIDPMKLPATLTVGDKAIAFHRSNVGGNVGYQKDVIFLDIVTDQGAVRLKRGPIVPGALVQPSNWIVDSGE